MVVTDDGEAIGSLTGGCVEAAVFELAQQVLADGSPQRASYGVSDGDAFAAGLMCGGSLDVLVAEPDESALTALLDRLDADEPCALATIVAGPAAVGAQLLIGEADVVGSTGTEGLDVAVTADGRGMLAAGQDGLRHYGPRGQRRIDDVTV